MLETLNILLFFIHLCALLASVGAVFYFLSIWASGKHQSAAVFPFQEVELGSGILGVALASLWLSALPAVILDSIAPVRYFSATGVALLAILTMVSCLALYLVLLLQDRVTRIADYTTTTGIHAGFRIVAAGESATLLLLLLLLMPYPIYPPEIAVLHPDEILPELITILTLLFGLFLVLTTIFKDSWFNHHRMDR